MAFGNGGRSGRDGDYWIRVESGEGVIERGACVDA